MMMQILKLRAAEKNFKVFYNNVGSEIYASPMKAEKFYDILQNMDEQYRHLLPIEFWDTLTEDAFFQNSMDISVSQHTRYIPPILHKHDFFELVCVLSESCTNYIKDRKLDLESGDILILAPHTIHALKACQDGCVVINILIRSSTLETHFLNQLPRNEILYNFFEKTLYHSCDMPYLLFKTGDTSVLLPYILQLYHESHRNNRYKNPMLSSMLTMFFVTLLRNYEKDVIIPSLNPSVMNENTLFILQYMQNHYATITLPHLAQFFNYSERHIQRIITSATGLSFSGNIKKFRMNQAEELLVNSSMTIQEISDSLGYYDASAFRQAFKKYCGKTPQEYRNTEKTDISVS